MTESPGSSYTLRVTHSDGQTTTMDVVDRAWSGLDSRLWYFTQWPSSYTVIKRLLISYRDQFSATENGWHMVTIDGPWKNDRELGNSIRYAVSEYTRSFTLRRGK